MPTIGVLGVSPRSFAFTSSRTHVPGDGRFLSISRRDGVDDESGEPKGITSAPQNARCSQSPVLNWSMISFGGFDESSQTYVNSVSSALVSSNGGVAPMIRCCALPPPSLTMTCERAPLKTGSGAPTHFQDSGPREPPSVAPAGTSSSIQTTSSGAGFVAGSVTGALVGVLVGASLFKNSTASSASSGRGGRDSTAR